MTAANAGQVTAQTGDALTAAGDGEQAGGLGEPPPITATSSNQDFLFTVILLMQAIDTGCFLTQKKTIKKLFQKMY